MLISFQLQLLAACSTALFAMWHVAVMWKQQQEQHGRSVMVRDRCELQRIRYVSLHLWVFQICHYKCVGSPIKVCIEHQEKTFHCESSTVLEWVTQRRCAISILGCFHDLARQSHSWPVKCWQQLCFEQDVGLETSRGPFWPVFLCCYVSLRSQRWADKPCFGRAL